MRCSLWLYSLPCCDTVCLLSPPPPFTSSRGKRSPLSLFAAAPGPSTAENSPLLLQPLSTALTSAETYGASSPSKLLLSQSEGEGVPLSRYGTKTVKVVLTKFARLCNGRKHTCPECGFVSESLAGIIQHRRVHTGEVPHKCNKCGKCFKSSSYLDKHCSRNTCQQNSLAPDAPLEDGQVSYEGEHNNLVGPQ